MPRLPPLLEPAFPVVKRVHRLATRRVGGVTRAVARRRPSGRTLPAQAWVTASETAAREPRNAVLHPLAPAEHLVRPEPEGQPARHPFWPTVTESWSGARFVLELHGGHVVGDYAAHLTAEGRLDFETSPYFGIRGWREHPVYLRPWLPSTRHISGTVVSLATRGTGVNYYHFLMDALQRWGTFREAFPDVVPDAVVLGNSTRYARELIDRLGISASTLVPSSKHLHVSADRLLVPSITNTRDNAPRWTTTWLREELKPRSTGDRPHRRLYITRGQRAHSRRVTNESAVLEALRPLGFEVVDPGRLSVSDQVDTFAAATAIVAPHGAGLTNLVFAPPGVRVLELFAPRYLNTSFWAIASNLDRPRYRYLVGSPSWSSAGPMNGVYDDITVDLPQLRACLEELLGEC